MASSASDAGHSEKLIREQLVKTGAVDILVSISNNFFYTRSLPCTLWFYDRAKEKEKKRRDKILMLDARKVYRKVSTTINDFSPEQLENLTAIVKLYRGDKDYFAKVLQTRLRLALKELNSFVGSVKTEMEQVLKIAANIKGLINIEFEDPKDTLAYIADINGLANIVNELSTCQLKLLSGIGEYDEGLGVWEDMLKDKQNAHNALNNQWIMLQGLHHRLQPEVKIYQSALQAMACRLGSDGEGLRYTTGSGSDGT